MSPHFFLWKICRIFTLCLFATAMDAKHYKYGYGSMRRWNRDNADIVRICRFFQIYVFTHGILQLMSFIQYVNRFFKDCFFVP